MVIKEETAQGILGELARRRWSDAGIGREIGVTRQCVWLWRTGRREPLAWESIKATLLGLLERP